MIIFHITSSHRPLGSFFEKYPRHDTLISINKVYTTERNEEFNFRHDWNSLISDNLALRYKHYSKEFFPSRHVCCARNIYIYIYIYIYI